MINKYYNLFLCFWSVKWLCGQIPNTLQGLDRSIARPSLFIQLIKIPFKLKLAHGKGRDKRWHRIYLVSAVIGRNGLAAAGEKKEGDGKTPSGIYPLGPAFGYASSIDTGLAIPSGTDLDFWVDDVQSMQYNQWVSGMPVARSFERMKRSDNLYQYGIVIGYNTHPVIPGAG